MSQRLSNAATELLLRDSSPRSRAPHDLARVSAEAQLGDAIRLRAHHPRRRNPATLDNNLESATMATDAPRCLYCECVWYALGAGTVERDSAAVVLSSALSNGRQGTPPLGGRMPRVDEAPLTDNAP